MPYDETTQTLKTTKHPNDMGLTRVLWHDRRDEPIPGQIYDVLCDVRNLLFLLLMMLILAIPAFAFGRRADKTEIGHLTIIVLDARHKDRSGVDKDLSV